MILSGLALAVTVAVYAFGTPSSPAMHWVLFAACVVWALNLGIDLGKWVSR